MLYYDRIDVSEGIDVNETRELKECDIFYYYFFLDKAFKFQQDICHGYRPLLMMPMNVSDNTVLKIHGADCFFIFFGISKSGTINLTNELRLACYELRVTIYCVSYKLVFTYELRVITYYTSYKLLFAYGLRVITNCAGYELILHTSCELLFIAQVTSKIKLS